MRERALVVDDDRAVGDLAGELLSETGVESLVLTDSAKAAKSLQEEKFAMVLLDLRMPAPDGITLVRQLRASGLNRMTPVILLSEDQSPSAVSQAFQAGASFFLYKPLDRSRLLKLITATQGAVEHERRRFRRIPLRSRVRLIVDRMEWEGETIDVSLNGMMVQGRSSIPAGSAVHVSLFAPPGPQPINGSGLVRRLLSENRMGIQLNELVQAERRRLQEFLLPLIQEEPSGGKLGEVLSAR
ncbi:MAG: response regulator [Candidatus Acidiferrales bacterium]